jgi:hypothetical protein
MTITVLNSKFVRLFVKLLASLSARLLVDHLQVCELCEFGYFYIEFPWKNRISEKNFFEEKFLASLKYF